MSRLQEWEAKGIVARYGIPVPSYRHCKTEQDIESALADLAFPVYVKAQIPIGDRKAAGAICVAADADEASAAARRLLRTTFARYRPDGVLIESAIAGDRELYLAVTANELERCRCLAIARSGGSRFDAASVDAVLLIDPMSGMTPMYDVRKLVRSLGFTGPELVEVAAIAHGLIRCAAEVQAYAVELNPVLLTSERAVAVDAKIELDDYAGHLRPAEFDDLSSNRGTDREVAAATVQRADHRGTLRYVQMLEEDEIARHAAIGTHSVGGGESLVVLDALESVGLTAANYCDTSGSPSAEKVAAATDLIASQPGIVGYFFSSCIANQPLSVTALGLVDGFERARWRGPTVVRIAGNEEDEARAIVSGWADQRGVRARVFGREVDEWVAAAAMSELLEGAAAAG